MAKVIDGASAVSGLRKVIGGASTVLVREVTRACDGSAISVLVGMSAAPVLGDVISNANAASVPENMIGDSRKVSGLEDGMGGASPETVLGDVINDASGAAVPGDAIGGENSVSVWGETLGGTRAVTVLGDVINCASGASVLGNVTRTGGTGSVSLMGDVLDSPNAVPVPGDGSGVESVVSLTRTQIGIVINGMKAASMLRKVDSGNATLSELGGVNGGAGAVPVRCNVFVGESAISVLGVVIGDASASRCWGIHLSAKRAISAHTT